MDHDNLWLAGCLMAASSVGFGAFGAHGLRKMNLDASKIKSWETAAHYQLMHSIGMLVSLSMRSRSNKSLVANDLLPAKLLLAGSVLFSGSIYCLVWNSVRYRWMGPVTPLGGLLMIGGWVALGLSSAQNVV